MATNTVFGRRNFLYFLLGFLSPLFSAHAGQKRFKSGDLLPDGLKVETSGFLELDRAAILTRQKAHRVWGDGHFHELIVSEVAWSRLHERGSVVIRSGIGGKYPHAHWISVFPKTLGETKGNDQQG